MALFFCGGMLVAAAKTLKGAISDASGAYDAVLGLAYTAGAGYLGMAAALFKWRDALLPTAAQAAQLEAELAAAKMLPAAQQQPKRGGLFGFGAQRDTPPPPPGGGPAPVQPAGAAAHKPVSTAGGAWGMV